MASIQIDNRTYEVEEGKNLLHVCLSLGLDLPYFCWHPAMGSVGACRQCAIKQYKDESDDQGSIVMACMNPAKDGTRISITDTEAEEFRASVIEWLMINHPHDCPVCEEGGECHLQDMTQMTGHTYRRYRFKKRTYRNQYLGPFINHEMNRCITCYRCVRFYKDYAGGRDLDAQAVHNHVYFGREREGTLESEFSGNLVEVCPTGVFTDKTLGDRYTRKWDLRAAPSVCQHCGVGCNISPNERYGKVKRIVNRYNHAVNGYFICDRGRFGYDYVNGEHRVLEPWRRDRDSDNVEAIDREAALSVISEAMRGQNIIGIGSPRASLETNFALRELVGAEYFYNGLSAKDHRLAGLIRDILRDGPSRTPSVGETEDCDAVLVLGEDLPNTAPRLALSLRQATRQAAFRRAEQVSLPIWQDAGVREATPGVQSPLIIATPIATRLDDAASRRWRAAPDDIARFGFAVAALLSDDAPRVDDLPEEVRDLAEQTAEALRGAKRPLVVSGAGCGNEALIRAAANVAWALQKRGRDEGEPAGLSFVLPEANTFGAALLEGDSVDAALDRLEAGVDTVIIAENDLYRRADAPRVDAALAAAKHVIVLDQVFQPTAGRADLVLPAATFAGSDGTLVNSEGRAQRFFAVLEPDPRNQVMESWRWLSVMGRYRETPTRQWLRLDQLIDACADAVPALQGIREAAPSADFRLAGNRIAREPHRYSGRTAINANVSVHEPQPPSDPDSPFSYTMEGHHGDAPGSVIPFFWAPGWNSEQSVNKFQDEVDGPLRGGDGGKRLIEPTVGAAPNYFTGPPAPFRTPEHGLSILPLHEVFGSDELSALSPPLGERIPHAYAAVNSAEADRLGLTHGRKALLRSDDTDFTVPVRVDDSLPDGIVGLPLDLAGLRAARGADVMRISGNTGHD